MIPEKGPSMTEKPHESGWATSTGPDPYGHTHTAHTFQRTNDDGTPLIFTIYERADYDLRGRSSEKHHFDGYLEIGAEEIVFSICADTLEDAKTALFGRTIAFVASLADFVHQARIGGASQITTRG